MPCYYPLEGYRAKRPNPSGKYSIVFNPKEGYTDQPITVPCGQCIGCRLERSRQWAIRCVHEASLHEDNSFITLTYDDDHLPTGATLEYTHYQNFMKYLRRDHGDGIKFYMCGEYGYQYDEQENHIKDSVGRPIIGRPHYHAILFGMDFKDKYHFKDSPSGMPLYRSEILEGLWTKGFSSIGTVTFESAAYVARYTTKKINGELEEEICDQGLRHYERLTDDGEIISCKSEFTRMSNRPGIGKRWYEHYAETDIWPHDSVIMNGKEVKPPRYYVDQLPEHRKLEVKGKRKKEQAKKAHDNTLDRLRDKEKVKLAAISTLHRKL